VPGSVTLDGIDNGQATFTVSTTSQTPKGPPPNSVIVHAVFKTAQGPLAHDVAITVNVD